MREEPLWIDRDELHLLYARQVELFGGASGVRDENLVESALHRPRMRFHYEADADLFDCAAAYLVGFTKNHRLCSLRDPTRHCWRIRLRHHDVIGIG